MLDKNKWIIAAVAVFLCISGCLYSMWYHNEDAAFLSSQEDAILSLDGDETSDGTSLEGTIQENTGISKISGSEKTEDLERGKEQAPEEQEKLIVYICGCVKQPGVYTLASGSRIADVLELCGGFTKNAADTVWNLAEKITDGQKIYVPSKKEQKKFQEEGLLSGQTFKEQKTFGDGGFAEANQGQVSESSGGASQKKLLNINTAGREELMTLPGIGESKADSIIAYREEHGGFAAVEELMQIRGIKEGVFDKIRSLITVN